MTAHAKNSRRQAAPKFSLVFIHMAEDSLTIYIAVIHYQHTFGNFCSVLHTSAYQKQGLLFVTAHAKNSSRQAGPKFSLVFIHMAEDSLTIYIAVIHYQHTFGNFAQCFILQLTRSRVFYL